MSLDLGTLVGKLELDGSKFDATLDKLPEAIKGKSALMAGAAGIAAGGITMALAKGIDTGLDMQDAGNKAMAELGLTKAESADIGKIAGNLYSNAYGDSIDGVGDAVTDVVSSIQGMGDASNKTVEGMTAKVLDFNSAFGIETGRTTQLVGQMLKTGLASDANEAMDLLTAAMQRVPKAVREDVLDATDEYGPFFAQLGLSGSEAMQALVKGSETGMYGIDKTGDALKELTIRATDMSASSKVAYESAGLDMDDMANRFLAGGDTAKGALSDLVSGLQGIDDPAEQAQAAIGLFGTPLEDLGVGKIPAFLDSLSSAGGGMDDFAGSTEKMGKAINGGARTGWTQLTRSFETSVGVIGAQLVPALTDMLNWLNKNPAVMKVLIGVVGFLALAFVVLTAATWAMNTALLANPITWIVLAIVAAVALLVVGITLLVQHWSEVTAWLGDVGGAIWGWLQGVIQGFVDWWNGLWGGFAGMVGDAVSGVLGWLGSLGDMWTSFWSNLGSAIAEGWNLAIAFLAGLPAQILGALAVLGQAIVAGLAALPGLLYDGLTTGIAMILVGLYTLFVALPIQISTWLAGAATWLLQTGINLINGMLTGIRNGWLFVTAWLAALPGLIVAMLAAAGTWLISRGVALLNGLRSGITSGWTAVAAFFAALPGRLLAYAAAFGSLLISRGTALLNGLRSGITSGASAVWSFMSSLPGRIVGYLASFGSLLVSKGTALLNGLRSGISSGWSAVGSFMASLPGKIVSGLGNLGSTLLSAGGDLMRGLLSGIRGGLGNILGAIGGMAGDIMSKFKGMLGIHSPSRVFAGYGLNIGQGLVNGLVGMQSDVDSAVSDLVSIPTARIAVAGTLSGMSGALDGVAGGTRGGSYATLEIHGNVGWMPDEVLDRMAAKQEQAMALEGLDMVGVK